MRKLKNRNAAFFAAGGFVAALFLAGAAHAITDTVFKYSTPQTGYVSLGPFAFGPATNNVSYSITPNYISSSEVGDVCFLSGVNLPNGATITQVRAWFASNSGNAQVTFWRQPVGSFVEQVIVEKHDTDTSGSLQPIAVNVTQFATVDNAHFFYEIMGCFDSNDTFHGVRITYTYTNAGD
jgi:hypothetical protein